MKEKYKPAFMDVAKRFAALSSAVRLKVGAIVVKDDRVISIGYNGMPPGQSNVCEYKDYQLGGLSLNGEYLFVGAGEYPLKDEVGNYKLVTKPEVIHAEANAIAKLAKSHESGDGAYMFVTHAPCVECSKQIFTAGIRKVFYEDVYRDDSGLKFLEQVGVEVERIITENNS